ncbi:MAG: Na/Pi cotransporter family protein [Ruminococcaceae bacterium]|nr:Na/Pi cotransporter family protein [Oscillospiraceae bacterium]
MTIFDVFLLLGGLAFFLYGMNVLSGGLEKLSGGKLERTLRKMTDNPFKSLVLGAGITIAIQSSSAMTVMLVGLVNSGIMQLSQTVGVIMGSNIGTTLTAWILSLAGIESNNVFIKMLKPESFSPLVAFIGIALVMMAKKQKKKDIGEIMVGFAVLMYGMVLMGDAMEPLQSSPEFISILTAFNNPIIGVLVGALFTGIIQSSAASVGILQTLAMGGNITYGMAIPIIMGQNIGTCITAVISSFGVNKNAKRVSVVHIAFNIIGTVICLILFFGLNAIFNFAFVDSAINPMQIALCHSIFNVFVTIILLPASNLLVKIAEKVIPDKASEEETYTLIDERLLNTPSFAISECINTTVEMAKTAKDSIRNALSLLENHDEKIIEKILADEDKLDFYEDKLGSYLVKLSSKELSDSDSRKISRLLHTIGDLERLGDHAVNLVKTAREIDEKQIEFSAEASRQLSIATNAIFEIVDITVEAFCKNDIKLAENIEPLEQVVDGLMYAIRSGHINRLQSGECTIELGFVLSDIINNFERISDHCSNIGVTIIEIAQNSYDTHEYLNAVKSTDNSDFKAKYNEYAVKYSLK